MGIPKEWYTTPNPESLKIWDFLWELGTVWVPLNINTGPMSLGVPGITF